MPPVLISSQSSTIKETKYPTAAKEKTLLEVLKGYQEPLLETHLFLKPGGEPADRKRVLIQLLALQYLRCHLALVRNVMNMISASYAQKQRERMDPRKISLTRSVLAELMVDAFYCEDLREDSLIITELLSSMLDILSESIEDEGIHSSAVRRLCAEVRVECSAQTRLATRIVERFESRLRFFERFRESRIL